MNKNLRINVIWLFAKKHILLFAVAEVCILVSYTVSLLLPLNLKSLTDDILYGGKHDLLGRVIIIYVILFAVAAVFNILYGYVWQTLNNRYVLDLKNQVFRKIVFAKASFLSGMNSGDMMSRIDYDTEQFLHIIQRNLFHFINSAFLCAGILVVVAQMYMLIAVILVIAAILPIVFTRICSRHMGKCAAAKREEEGKLSGKLFEILKGIREIKFFCAESQTGKILNSGFEKVVMLCNKMRRIDFAVDKGVHLINLCASIVIYGVCAYFISKGEITIGVFLAVIEYVALLHKKFNWMLRIFLEWHARKISVDRVNEVLTTESEPDQGLLIEQIETIEFKNVTFRYEETEVLQNISFEIKKGEKVAIVGQSGVGKTTIAGLITGLYQPVSGTIYINGIDIKEIKLSSLRRCLSVVSQDVFLFEDSIKNNLTMFGKFSDHNLASALQMTGLDGVVDCLEQGVQTQIGSGSAGLSGGQKQRLMIARAVVKEAKTIILDEATSSLDKKSGHNMFRLLFDTFQDNTIVVISHCISNIEKCGKIIVLNAGEIEKIGSHEELIKSSYVYRSLFGKEVCNEA